MGALVLLGQTEGQSVAQGALALQDWMTCAATALEANGAVTGPLSNGIAP